MRLRDCFDRCLDEPPGMRVFEDLRCELRVQGMARAVRDKMTDEEMIAAVREIGSAEGLFVAPEGASYLGCA